MYFDEKIYQEFLLEMQSLETFRATHTHLHYDTPLEQIEDPDMKRLIEALAFFSARTHMQAMDNITHTHEKIFRQYFPYLLQPLPAMTLVQFKPSLRLTGKLSIPRGTELFFQTLEKKTALFQTLEELILLPLFYEKFEMISGEKGGQNLIFSFEASHSQIEQLKEVKLFVNHLGNFASALSVLYAIHHTLEKILVSFDGEEEELGGLGFEKEKEKRLFKHPIEHLRSLFHFPQQELFLPIQLPERHTKWKTLKIRLELTDRWPKTLQLKKDSFATYVVPVINLAKSIADPILCDGKSDSYPLLHPSPNGRFVLHSLLSVSDISSSEPHPLRPGILGHQEDSYEIDYATQTLSLNVPGSFVEPKTIIVEALWSQPWLSKHLKEEISPYFAKDSIPGVELQILGMIEPQENLSLEKDPNILLKILALKNQNQLNLDEILLLLNTLKQLEHSKFKRIASLIQKMSVDQKQDRLGVGLSMEYIFELKELSDKNWNVVVIFFRNLNAFLNTWLPNFQVTTKVIFPRGRPPLVLKGEESNELQILARNFFLS
jgi:type VI secretion system protein ImpG